jgi:hypothetical protein
MTLFLKYGHLWSSGGHEYGMRGNTIQFTIENKKYFLKPVKNHDEKSVEHRIIINVT